MQNIYHIYIIYVVFCANSAHISEHFQNKKCYFMSDCVITHHDKMEGIYYGLFYSLL